MADNVIIKDKSVQHALSALRKSLDQELDRIMGYWQTQMVDENNGGFYGKRLWDEQLVEEAPKGVVLNARILWTFAAAYKHTGNEAWLQTAHRAYKYIVENFIDSDYGGVYWSINYNGSPFETKKQVYAQSFTIYAFAEYYRITNNEQAKLLAIELFSTIEKYSHDKKLGGYIEAFTREWLPIEDLRLSHKDANEKKTMNTHLHVLEGYTNLYRIYPDVMVREAIIHLLQVFDTYFIDKSTGHLVLFFDENWNRKGNQISYGHDIEAAWLLVEAAEVINDAAWIKTMKNHAVKIAAASFEGVDADHGMWHEYDADSKHLVKEKHWWPQAEAMVGFLQAWEISGDEKYLQQVLNSWEFIQNYILDKQNGEWRWGVNADYSLMDTEDKAGFWKCPYHNGRACIEVAERIGKLGYS